MLLECMNIQKEAVLQHDLQKYFTSLLYHEEREYNNEIY